MSLATRVFCGLGSGLIAGAAINASGRSALAALASWIEPIGTLWVNAILMTVVPLVVSSLVTAVASASDPRALGRLGGRAFMLFGTLSLASGGITAAIAPLLFGPLSIDPAALNRLHNSLTTAAVHSAQIPTVRQWVTGIVPANPVRAAADGALLPLVVFTLAFALALSRLDADFRVPVVRLFEGISRAMHVLVGWVLQLAPIGVFALALALAAQVGVAAAGAMGYYVVVASGLCLAFLLMLYPIVLLFAGVPMPTFARAAWPAQAVAFSSRSSLASLPALIAGAEARLAAPAPITSFFLPLAVSTFKYCGPAVVMAGAVFVARLFGVPLDAGRLFAATFVAAVLSFTIPGIPAGSIIAAAPAVLAVLGLPAEGVGILIALDAVPDMVRAPANVTGDLAVAALLGRRAAKPAPDAERIAKVTASGGLA